MHRFFAISNLQRRKGKRKSLVFFFLCLFLGSFIRVPAQNLTRPNIEGPSGLQVNSYTGNLFYQRADLFVPGRGLSVDIGFSYNSNDRKKNYGFGYGWSFTYNLFYKDSSGGVVIYRSDGRKDYYAGSGLNYTPPKGIFDRLSRGQLGELVLTAKDGTQYFFENAVHKKLTRIRDRNGNEISFSYTGANVKTITDASNRVFNFIFSGGLLQEINSSAGNPAKAVKYQYNNKDCLTGVRDALGHTISYSYGLERIMNGLTDAKRNEVQILYNQNAAVIKINSCLAEKSIVYDLKTNSTQVLDKTLERTLSTTYYFDIYGRLAQKTGNCCGYNTSYGYDANNNITSVVDANGWTTVYGYDDRGNVLAETDNYGKSIRYSYDAFFNQVTSLTDKNGNRTAFRYDTRGNLTQIDYPLSIVLKYAYDNFGNRTSFTDGRGKIVTYLPNQYGYTEARTDSAGTTHYAYDAWGNQLSITDPNNYKTQYTYNEINQLTQVEDARHGLTKFTYDFNGNLESVRDANGHLKKFSYDPNDKLYLIEGELNTATSMSFDGLGAMTTRTDANHNTIRYNYDNLNRPVAVTNAAGETTTYQYDGNGNKTAIAYPNGNRVSIAYDVLNRITQITDQLGVIVSYTYDANSNKLSETDGVGNTITYRHDALNRLVFKADPSGNFYNYEYDQTSNLVKQTDRNGFVTRYNYDALNRIVTETDALSNETSYAYDDAGNPTSVRDANGNLTRYQYDELNRKIRETFADNGIRQYGYDDVGNLVTRTDNKGQSTTYLYDPLDRLIYRKYPNNAIDTFSYDAGGRMKTAVNNRATVEFTYDVADRLLSEKLNGVTTGYAYNIAAGTKTITYPGGRVIQRQVDGRSRLTAINEGGTAIAQFVYNNAGRNTQRNFANGTTNSILYNSKGLVAEYKYAPAHFTDAVYNYDREDNPVAATNAGQPLLTEQYSHDKVNQLVDFKKGNQHQSFDFDKVGNRKTANINGTPVSYAVNNMNAYSSIVYGGTTTTPLYDGNGSVTDDGRNSYNYDFENRIIAVNGGAKAKYNYDATGRRIQKIAGSDTINYFFSGLQVVEERNASNTIRAAYVWGTWVDDIISMTRNGNTYYYNTSTNGSVISVTNTSGAIVERYEYEGFGRFSIYNGSNALINASAFENVYTFSGREYDVETGLYYYRARHYDAWQGRFLQRDPLGYIDGLGLYEYTDNNPLLNIDPTGTSDVNSNERNVGYCANDPFFEIGEHCWLYPEDCSGRADETLAPWDVLPVGEGLQVLKYGFRKFFLRGGDDVLNKGRSWFDELGNPIYPTNEFLGKPKEMIMKEGTQFDRYGTAGGKYASPVGTSYTKRSLSPGSERKDLTQYEVIKEFKANKGKVKPWFGEKGRGTQYKFNNSIQELIDRGYIKKIKK